MAVMAWHHPGRYALVFALIRTAPWTCMWTCLVLMWTCHGSCVVKPRAPRARATRHAHRTVYIYLPPEEGTSDERAKKDPALLSAARPTSLASETSREPNHSGGVAGCTHENLKGVRGSPWNQKKRKRKKDLFINIGALVFWAKSFDPRF